MAVGTRTTNIGMRRFQCCWLDELRNVLPWMNAGLTVLGPGASLFIPKIACGV